MEIAPSGRESLTQMPIAAFTRTCEEARVGPEGNVLLTASKKLNDNRPFHDIFVRIYLLEPNK